MQSSYHFEKYVPLADIDKGNPVRVPSLIATPDCLLSIKRRRPTLSMMKFGSDEVFLEPVVERDLLL
jgi:hypothetical protein